MRLIRLTLCTGLVVAANFVAVAATDAEPKTAIPQSGAVREVTRAFLLDRIHGGWAGMLIGGLEGLPHEFKHNEQPSAALPEFTFLEQGARSDDDNDFEWTHLWYMDKEGVLKLPYPRLVEIWKANMNQGIWVANKRARELMDQGVVPPATGSTSRQSPCQLQPLRPVLRRGLWHDCARHATDCGGTRPSLCAHRRV